MPRASVPSLVRELESICSNQDLEQPNKLFKKKNCPHTLDVHRLLTLAPNPIDTLGHPNSPPPSACTPPSRPAPSLWRRQMWPSVVASALAKVALPDSNPRGEGGEW